MERSCIKGQRVALTRLAAVTTILGLLGMFACRPAWSPDGKRLLFSGRDNDGSFVAFYDRETGNAERILATPINDEFSIALWAPDGKRAIVVSGPNSDGITVSVTSVPPMGDPLVHKVRTKLQLGESSLLMGSAVIGGHLFVTGGVLRVDLKTGQTKQLKAKKPGARLVVVARGAGLCCIEVEIAGGQELAWEMTVLDPVTLQRSPLLSSEDLPDVKCTPLPVFSGDLERIAIPSDKRHEVLVFRAGKLEATLPLGAEGTVMAHDIAMPADGATIYASVCRNIGNGRFAWSLVEGTIDGVVVRERRLFASDKIKGAEAPGAMPGIGLGLVVSPDLRVAALTTVMTPEARPRDKGLYLVDLVGGQRTVTKVAFPKARTISMTGSDYMRELVKQWASDYGETHAQSILVSGGGSGVGLAALAAGKCDLAMTARKVEPAEIDLAKKANVEFEEHLIVRKAITVCVNKKNALASLTMEQLAKVYGADGVTKWSDLGVEMPKAMQNLAVGVCRSSPFTFMSIRVGLLGSEKFGSHVALTTSDEDLLAFAARNQNAIVCLSSPAAARHHLGVRIVPIRRDAETPPMQPEEGSLRNGTYPLISTMFVYSRKGGSANAARFLRWLDSEEGWRSTESAGF